MPNKSFDLDAIPKPIKEMLTQMDPAALKSLLASLPKEKVKPMLAEAMGYVRNMPAEEKEALKSLITNFVQGNDS